MAYTRDFERIDLEYAGGRYSEVIRACVKILNGCRDNVDIQLRALDWRCRANMKLGQAGPALQDARQMIRVGRRQQAQGYQRAAQINTTLGDYVEAVKWLEHGCKNVPNFQSVFKTQLDHVNDLARNAAALPKRRDPLSTIPLEIWEIILSNFSYTELVRLLHVSKAWNRLLSQNGPVSTSIDFSEARRTVSLRSCRAAFARLGRTPRSLRLDNLSPQAKAVVESWLSNFLHLEPLENLEIPYYGPNLCKIRLNKLLSIKNVRFNDSSNDGCTILSNLLEDCPSLQRIDLRNIVVSPIEVFRGPKRQYLKYLQLSGGSDTNRTKLPADFFERFPCLKTFIVKDIDVETNIWDFTSNRCLQHLSLDGIKHGGLRFRLPPSIEKLSMCDVSGVGTQPWFEVDLDESLPRLHTLHLYEHSIEPVLYALGEYSKISRLHCMTLVGFTVQMLDEFYPSAEPVTPSCKQLYISSPDLSDDDIEAFIRRWPSVESMTLHAPWITGAFLREYALRNGSCLEDVVLKDCIHVSHDTPKYLSQHGILCKIGDISRVEEGVHRVREIW